MSRCSPGLYKSAGAECIFKSARVGCLRERILSSSGDIGTVPQEMQEQRRRVKRIKERED